VDFYFVLSKIFASSLTPTVLCVQITERTILLPAVTYRFGRCQLGILMQQCYRNCCFET